MRNKGHPHGIVRGVKWGHRSFRSSETFQTPSLDRVPSHFPKFIPPSCLGARLCTHFSSLGAPPPHPTTHLTWSIQTHLSDLKKMPPLPGSLLGPPHPTTPFLYPQPPSFLIIAHYHCVKGTVWLFLPCPLHWKQHEHKWSCAHHCTPAPVPGLRRDDAQSLLTARMQTRPAEHTEEQLHSMEHPDSCPRLDLRVC